MVKLGVLYQGIDGARPSEIGAWVEDLGYDSIWVGDHVLSYVDGLTTAMALGAATRDLVVGTAILLVPLRHPALLARSLATLAMEMPARFVLGAGAGGDVPAEFEVLDVPLAGRGARMERTLVTVRTTLDDGVLGDHPFAGAPAEGCPPVWFGGRTDRAARRAAELGDGFIPYLVTPAHYAALLDQVAERRAAGPRAGLALTRGVDVMVSVAPTAEEALSDSRAYQAYGLDDEQLLRHTVLGTPDDVVAGLAAYVERGAEHLILHVTAPPQRKRDQIALLATCLDRVRSLSATGASR